ncbi:TadE/TadG family type IV pilus assembly protein [Candidatus Binatus sp.]|uniref:TadE/TadG family type IV pilus assembly protein n=1 Tax=Candidatus Binatus sp. TaxID=2811406 RepID=UPI003CC51F5E
MSRLYRSMRTKLTANYRGQAMVEFAMGVTLMLIIMCACIDFGRALNDVQVMADLTRQGSNLASRGTTLNEAAAAVVSGASGLDLANHGNVIITSVTNENNVFKISGQDSSTTDGLTKLAATSKIGSSVGATATLPAAYTTSTLQNGQTVYITEVFFAFSALTPIGALTNSAVSFPSTLYNAAYF